MRLVLIRHGLTDYNLRNKYCGSSDIGINKIGKLQARAIKNKIKGLKIDKVFCSDLKRSFQTAKIIFGDCNIKIIRNRNLREINFGKWEGLNFKQIIQSYPLTYKKWLKNPFTVNIPEGEKAKNFIIRIKNELGKIIKNNRNSTVAVVGHFGVIRTILNSACKVKRKDFWRMKLNPRAIYIVEYNSKLKPKVYDL